MAGKLLIVDPVPTNRIIMRVKLAAAFFEVVQASTAQDAIQRIRDCKPDLVLCAAELPDMPGRTLCHRIRQRASTARLPLVLMLESDTPSERLSALASGADDALARPLDDAVMFARIRSLLRARDAEAELLVRDDPNHGLGLAEPAPKFVHPASVLITGADRTEQTDKMLEALSAQLRHRIEFAPYQDVMNSLHHKPDVVVLVEGGLHSGAGVSMLPQLRATSHARNTAVVYMCHRSQNRNATSALDMGAQDLVFLDAAPDELALRIERLIAQKRTGDTLRATMHDGLRAAITDSLTGLHNRRYALPHLDRMVQRARTKQRPFAVLLADLDHFKQVNDQHGHVVGDTVLACFAQRLRDLMRPHDLISRYGGEEFLLALPDTNGQAACRIADRICALMANTPIDLPENPQITVTASLGIAVFQPNGPLTPKDLISQADRALYTAKETGRNRAVMFENVHSLPRPPHFEKPLPAKRRLPPQSQTRF